jgi:outer membrane protein assembly factor BamB
MDIETGKIIWEIQQVGSPESNYSGVLSTTGGLIFYGETGGTLAAVDAKTGRTLWRGFDGNASWKASPMTYMVNGQQHIAVTSGRPSPFWWGNHAGSPTVFILTLPD